ncbi:DUF3560 domain-containing protein [Kribbella pittospori]|uniref:DUF3560 domain-containing protein n=1 Tax=Kribbella pittospori TaxID=722689 RepID=A0A4R0JX83_9ACTN|nr:DUF3560 domain-containing protein [Kribbella pittospori]TCC52143.1 DUF3560 domain-containing protein [Kribbella pittospori]
MSGQIEIVHTRAEGTLATGTRRGDGSAEILKANNWRWSRQLEAWYIPRSRDQLAKPAVIDATANALRGAGFDVTLEVDDSASRSVEEREADRDSRARARSEMLQNRAQRRRDAADTAWEASRRIADGIPLGQPILIGHHSERRHRRELERIQNLASKSVGESRAAETDQRRADSLAGATEVRYSVRSVGRRIGRLEADLRKLQRQLEGYTRVIGHYEEVHAPATGEWADRLKLQLADLEAQLDYWAGVRDELAVSHPTYSHETVKKGDYVRVSGIWRKVERVNKKTVSVETGYSWTDRAAYHDLTGHRPGEEMDGPQL